MKTNLRPQCLRVAMILALWGTLSQSRAVDSLINFDDAVSASSAPASQRYANKGVYINNPLAETITMERMPTSPASEPRVLVSSPLRGEFEQLPLELEFTMPVRFVSVYTAVPLDTRRRTVRIEMTAFDGAGARIGNPVWADIIGPSEAFDTLLQIELPAGNHVIRKVVISAIQGEARTFVFVDDLRFGMEGVPPVLAAEPPSIYITSPSADMQSSTGSLLLEGTIYGEALRPDLSPPEIKISWPSQSTLSSWSGQLILGTDLWWDNPAHTALRFSRTIALQHYGDNVITVRAANPKGTSEASRIVTYFPSAITAEYNKSPGVFGAFVEGGQDGCAWGLFENGVIFASGQNTYRVLGDIFTKWKTLRSAGSVGFLGCATSQETAVSGHRWGTPQGSVFTVPGAYAQQFQNGRIYTSNKGAWYVTNPFMDAMDKLDFAVNFGLPSCDPVDQNKPLLPVRWQRFEPTDELSYFANLDYSAMELTENPLTLWIATPDTWGWVRLNFGSTLYGEELVWEGQYPSKGTDALQYIPHALPNRLPSTWRQYPCNSKDAPAIDVGKTPSSEIEIKSRISYADVLAVNQDRKYLGGFFVPLATPVAWQQFPSTLNKMVPLRGYIKSSHLTSEDFAWTHVSCSCLSFVCAVDWCMNILPDHGFENLLSSGFEFGDDAPFYPRYIESEYEHPLVGSPFAGEGVLVGFDDDKVYDYGDGIFMAGRHVVDNGHRPFKTEMHPPAVILHWHSEKTQFGLTTAAEVVQTDWWFPNQTVTTKLYAPPRATATSYPIFGVPIDPATGGISVQYLPTSAPNHMSITFSARTDTDPAHNPPHIDGAGVLYHGSPWGLLGPACYDVFDLMALALHGPTPTKYRSVIGGFSMRWTLPGQ